MKSSLNDINYYTVYLSRPSTALWVAISSMWRVPLRSINTALIAIALQRTAIIWKLACVGLIVRS